MRLSPFVRKSLLVLGASGLLGAAFVAASPAVVGLLAPPPCTSVNVSGTPRAMTFPGTLVSVNASSTGCLTPEYQFYLQPPGGSWTAQGPFSTAATFDWNTTGLAPAIWGIGVRARRQGTSVPYDVYALGTYAVVVLKCQGASISAQKQSPQPPGASIIFIADAGPCIDLQFRFLTQAPGGSWKTVQAYGDLNFFTWDTTGLTPGTWLIGVWARAQGSAASYDAYAFTTFTLLHPQRCLATDNFGNPASPQAAGTAVTFQARALACDTPEIEFWTQAPGAAWTIAQPYTSGDVVITFVWDTTGLADGRYQIGAWARQVGSPNRYDSYEILTYYIGT